MGYEVFSNPIGITKFFHHPKLFILLIFSTVVCVPNGAQTAGTADGAAAITGELFYVTPLAGLGFSIGNISEKSKAGCIKRHFFCANGHFACEPACLTGRRLLEALV